MIYILATKYAKRTALILLLAFSHSFLFCALAAEPVKATNERIGYSYAAVPGRSHFPVEAQHLTTTVHKRGGGPTQPEMSSFKSIGVNNMVNLFTGDFSYNIPLLDVGGYPVNIYYQGGIGMEQEASWVGLGWNINPGNISRNMRGVPDDFNTTDTLVQTENLKPNNTWGVSVGGDLEGIGIKGTSTSLNLGVSLGVSFNNYLGPALDLGVKGGVSFKIADKVKAEKDGTKDSMALTVGAGFSADLNSRSGLTLSPNVSLTASSFLGDRVTSAGIGLSTSYNSRSGIKELQLSEQMSATKYTETCSFDSKYRYSEKRYRSTNGGDLFATSISFARPSYLPALRIPMTNEAGSGRFQLGAGLWGAYGSVEAEVYKQSSIVTPSKIIQKKPLVGYMYYEKAMNNPNAVMDFTRLNDREVTPNTAIISAPQYSYDVFTIQGEGTGGSIRAYRDDLGYVRDNATASQDKSTGVGVDIGIPGHYGANVNIIRTPSTIGEWGSGNKLHTALPFKGAASGSTWENVYFRNPGESSVLDNGQFDRVGGTDLVRFKLSGDGYSPAIEPVLDRFSKSGAHLASVTPTGNSPVRKKRTQLIDFLTAADASRIGLERQIRSYNYQTILDGAADTLIYDTISRAKGYRKAHHISQVNVTETDGKRYVYGIPVYNIRQKDFTFTVGGSDLQTPGNSDVINYNDNDTDPFNNPAIKGGTGSRDGYVQVTETPAYAHSFLLSGLLSPDYVDITGDGITEDDAGSAVKFNYTCIKNPDGTPAVRKWRTPAGDHIAHFNAGRRSDVKDDKGIVSYGERESWYLHSIESRSMIAIFRLEDRVDGKGVQNEKGQVNPGDNTAKLLRRIDLYSKSDLKQNGLTGPGRAKPIKSVNFVYSYRLCQHTPDNPGGQPTPNDPLGLGKLTLDTIYFTFNGQDRSNKAQYVFSYVDPAGNGNPGYMLNATDRWGTYKPDSLNPGGIKNSDYPYTPQDERTTSPKAKLDQYAAAWSLKRILLPSGGQMDVQYESDDYAFVQNRRAAEMMSVAGFGNSPSSYSPRLYDLTMQGAVENDYAFVKVPKACYTTNEVYQRYLLGMDQVSFRLAVDMPAGMELLTSYADVAGYGLYDSTTIWLRLKKVNGLSPLSLTALEYLREQLPGQAFPGYDVSESSGLKQIGEAMAGWLYSLKNAFKDPVNSMRNDGKAQKVELGQSFVRLNDPDGFKYGGGARVRSVLLKDNWQVMTRQYNSVYGVTYDYTTTEVFNGKQRTISSGVASYEPSIGGEENPWHTIKQVADKLPLGPVSYGAVELPVLDAFFPAATVGYSKVTVRSMPSVKPAAGQKSRSGVGRQVTEFYTAKDFPVQYSNTALDPATDKTAHDASTTDFFYKYSFDSRALSQGFLVEINDMHGKVKSTSSYAENDTTLRVNYSENFYRNTGVNGLNESFDFVSASQGGTVNAGNMGIDIELMTDTREFSVKSTSYDVQGQVDLFPVLLPLWLPFIWPVTGNSENTYRAITTTKVVSYHSILDSVVVIDKGSQVSTKNLAFDSETGSLVVSKVNNMYDQPVYSTSYPAWWAYSGMGPAYRNTGVSYEHVSFYDGRLVTTGLDQHIFESGDELYVTAQGSDSSACVTPYNKKIDLLWALDKNKNGSSLTSTSPDLIFIDSAGVPFTKSNVSFRIVRSGKRNMLDRNVASAVSMVSPIVTTGGSRKLLLGSTSRVLNATAMECREKWQTDNDVIGKRKLIINASCENEEVVDCIGYLEKRINPYRKGLLGNFKNYRDLIFYGSRTDSVPTLPVPLVQSGTLSGFKLYWDFDANGNLTPDVSNAKWVWNTRITKINAKGMEIENKNALNIYTAAQYGYHKTLPLAITQNSRVTESFYEGFEDMAYKGDIDGEGRVQCPISHVDYTSMSNTQPVNTDTTSFTAHTGRYVLGVKKQNSWDSAVKSFPVQPAAIDDYSLLFGKDTARSLTDPGINITDIYQLPKNPPPSVTVSTSNGFFLGGHPAMDTIIETPNYCYTTFILSVNTVGYVMVPESGIYDVYTHSNESGLYLGQPTSFGIGVQLFASDGTQIGASDPGTGTSTPLASDEHYTMCLPKGIYKVVINCVMDQPSGDCDWAFTHATPSYNFSWKMSKNGGSPLALYKSSTLQNGCVSTTPIAATDSMFNGLFTIPASKKMVFSAWVREDCGTPCNLNTYTQSYVRLKFNDAAHTETVVKPAGPIIEGWQRYEAPFPVPATATSLTMSIKNTGSSMIYLDDIRIHPFNADMKSYVYDPVNLRLVAQLDENNYASFFEYDEEGTLIRTKAETKEGVKTIKETRSAKQRNINTIQ